MAGMALFDEGEPPDGLADARRVDVEEVQARRDLQVVLRAEVPRHHAGREPVVLERLDEVAGDGVDADRGTLFLNDEKTDEKNDDNRTEW